MKVDILSTSFISIFMVNIQNIKTIILMLLIKIFLKNKSLLLIGKIIHLLNIVFIVIILNILIITKNI